MKLLVSSCSGLYLFDTDTKKLNPIHNGRGTYYGVSWDAKTVYAVARGSNDDYRLGREKILTFNHNLRYTGELGLALENSGIHEILMISGRLWVTCALKPYLVTVDVNTGMMKKYKPPVDKLGTHINSLLTEGDTTYIMAHNRNDGCSRIHIVDGKSAKTIPCEHSFSSHNIFRLNGTLCVCSSLDSCVKSIYGDVVLKEGLEGYTRGVAVVGDKVAIGCSQRADRDTRPTADGWICLLKNDGTLLEKHHFPKIGQITNLRCIDGFDEAHPVEPNPLRQG